MPAAVSLGTSDLRSGDMGSEMGEVLVYKGEKPVPDLGDGFVVTESQTPRGRHGGTCLQSHRPEAEAGGLQAWTAH